MLHLLDNLPSRRRRVEECRKAGWIALQAVIFRLRRSEIAWLTQAEIFSPAVKEIFRLRRSKIVFCRKQLKSVIEKSAFPYLPEAEYLLPSGGISLAVRQLPV